MSTPSPRLDLALPSQSDPFSTTELRTNWEKLDAAPGTHICTSSTRPTWNSAKAGRKIYETDTRLEWLWDGAQWVRTGGSGLLRRNDGSFAIAERTTDFSTGSTTFVRVVTLTNVVVPAGNRPIRVDVSWNKARNPAGNFRGAIFRSNANNSGPIMGIWYFGTSTSDVQAGGGVFWGMASGGLAAGTYDFSMQITAPSGTSIIDATANTPTTIMVTEL